MTALLITIDTELSSSLHRKGVSLRDNMDRSIWGLGGAGGYGIQWQMDLMDRHGLKGTFFVDPLPALVYDTEFLSEIISTIVSGGHEVQLHIHTEWLAWAKHSPVEGRQGRNIGDFSLADQIVLLDLARKLLLDAGAPEITAFRAGNFGANDDTLRALAQLGMAWDSSVNTAYLDQGCAISADPGLIGAFPMLGIVELPVSGIMDRPGRFRPAQICAMSTSEMIAGLRHAVREEHGAYVIVTHSFEMLSRDRRRPNRAVMRRFDQLASHAASEPRLVPMGFRDLPQSLAKPDIRTLTRVSPSRLRTGWRMAQQAWATWRYERRLKPV